MMTVQTSTLINEIIFYSIINSFVTFGLLQTVKSIIDKEEISRFVGLVITYVLGIIMGFLLSNIPEMWHKLVYGIFIGCTSVAVYKSAVQALLGIIPSLVDKFFNVSPIIKNDTQVCNKQEVVENIPEGPPVK